MPPYSVPSIADGFAWRPAQPLSQVPNFEAMLSAFADTLGGPYW